MSAPDLLTACWTSAGDVLPLGDGRRYSLIPLHERIAAVAAAGFTGFGVIHDDLEIYLRDHTLTDLRAVLDDHGITHVELEFLEDWWLPETDGRANSARRTLLLRASEVLRPHHVKVGSLIMGGTYDLDQYAEGWYRTSAAFQNAGTVIAVEFMPFSNITTLADAVRLVQTAGHPAGGVLIDLWHVMRGGAYQVEQIADVPPEFIFGVEIDDGDAEPIGDLYTDTVLHRRLPGEGDWPVARFIRILRDAGYSGPWGVEILSESFRVRPLEDSLPAALAATLAQFDLAGSAEAQSMPPGSVEVSDAEAR